MKPSREKEHKNKTAAPKKSGTQHWDGSECGKPPAEEQERAFFLFGGSSDPFYIGDTFWNSLFKKQKQKQKTQL